jgi:chromate transporter
LKDNPPVEGPAPRRLGATTIAVVGVILNLAVFFAWHSFWPLGTACHLGFERLPVGVTIAAFIAFWKFKADIMKVIGGCALLGSIYSNALSSAQNSGLWH